MKRIHPDTTNGLDYTLVSDHYLPNLIAAPVRRIQNQHFIISLQAISYQKPLFATFCEQCQKSEYVQVKCVLTSTSSEKMVPLNLLE